MESINRINLNKSFLVVGCGGLGCFIIEFLLRLGVKKIVVCDPDVFDESNLNRQLYSTPVNIGTKKVTAAMERAKELRFKGEFTALDGAFERAMLEGIDIAIDNLWVIAETVRLADNLATLDYASLAAKDKVSGRLAAARAAIDVG